MIDLHLTVTTSGLALFYALLEKGVVLKAQTGCTLRNFLCAQIGISGEYLDQRVQTLFLNAKPVDDVDTAVVSDGATLALSTAMPGLVGATMRKGGRYAAFRKTISQSNNECRVCSDSGRVTVKLFNMVAREIGAHLLEAGVEVDGSALSQIADRHTDKLLGAIVALVKDGDPTTPDKSFFSDLSGRRIRLSIILENQAG